MPPGDRGALDAFFADLLAGDTATRVLEARCGGRVHAELVDGAAPAERRARLDVGADEPLGYGPGGF